LPDRSRVLVIAAHPDDEVLGCGGTIARFAAEGDHVTIAILGEGITSRYAEREHADGELLADLQSDARRAADRLGAAELITHHLPDNRFDTVPLIEVVKLVEHLVARVQPRMIFTHRPSDLNIDHGVVHRAVLTATRPLGADAVREIYAFEVPSSSEWAFGQFGAFRPGLFVDISATIGAKIEAMEVYESEARPFPHPRSPEALEALARRWGSAAGVAAAEAFEVVRRIL
jgi:LmbE family N-acetylglucosaminyl deacetylase